VAANGGPEILTSEKIRKLLSKNNRFVKYGGREEIHLTKEHEQSFQAGGEGYSYCQSSERLSSSDINRACGGGEKGGIWDVEAISEVRKEGRAMFFVAGACEKRSRKETGASSRTVEYPFPPT